jgi:hypothetical protein
MKAMKIRTTQLAGAVAAALVAIGGTAQAQAPLEAKASGQVSRVIMYADDGTDKRTFNADNEISGTRFRFAGSAGMTPQIRAGVLLEWDYQSNESNAISIQEPSEPSPSGSPSLVERYMEAWFEWAGFGTLRLGQGDGAANNGTEVDLSGTGIITSAFVSELGGGVNFRTPGSAVLGPTIASVITQQDFESRYDRVMYVSPTFGGFRAQVSNGTKDSFATSEASLWYAAKLGALGDLAAAIGWSNQGSAAGQNDDETIGGSVSWLHGSGINLTYAHSQREIPVALPASREGKFDYIKIGYKFGQHAIAADYGIGKDQAAVGDEAKAMGVGYVWSPIGWAELYAGYRIFSLDRAAGQFDDVSVLTIGTRLKF